MKGDVGKIVEAIVVVITTLNIFLNDPSTHETLSTRATRLTRGRKKSRGTSEGLV